MAMVVANNIQAQLTLGEVRRNDTTLTKSLKKVASGVRITGAGDAPSEYGISERMSVRLRSLNQDTQNVQNGRCLSRVAEGAQQRIVDNLRDMKRMALDAANDTNTDADRATINKEYQKRMDTIDDIASETSFNGKILLDGTYCTLRDPDKLRFADAFSAYAPDTQSVGRQNTVYTQGQYPVPTDTPNVPYDCRASFRGTSNSTWGSTIPGNSGIGSMGVKMDFSSLQFDGVMPSALDKTGFSMFCGGCNQFVVFKFDATTTETKIDGTDNSNKMVYTVGVQNCTDIADLADVVFEGFKKAKDSSGNTRPYTKANGKEYISLDRHHNFGVAKIGQDIVLMKDYLPDMLIYDKAIVDPPEYRESNPLVIHSGTKANEAMKLNFNDMRSDALMIRTSEVTSREKANNAIGTCEAALSYALNEITRTGSYTSRMDFTESTLVTASEYTQASESTIRDADMAREMTEYTKANVLLQASQSMLAQANSNSSQVLSLLQ